jgi:putative tryptophan/tyrosine transport system substrate-binding protein
MRRREFIAALIASAAGYAAAQEPAKTKRIAVVSPAVKVADMRADKNPVYRIFFDELNHLGYIEGHNLVVERYSAEGARERHAELAREVVGTRPDLICVFSVSQALAFKTATTEIPVVVMATDPVALGIVPSLAHPGGNITGVAADAGIEFFGKRLELLRELVPKLSNVFYLASQPHWERRESSMAVREAAKRMGISLTAVLLGATINEAAYESAFKSMEQDKADALLISNEGEHFAYRAALVELVAKSRLPAMFPSRYFVDIGGLMTYTGDFADVIRHIVSQIAVILKGTKPKDIPFYQATKFELVINMKAAKSQGIEVPPTLLARADEVIE